MKTNQLNQTIENAEATIIKGLAGKKSMEEIIQDVQTELNFNGVNASNTQATVFVEEYLSKRKTGEK